MKTLLRVVAIVLAVPISILLFGLALPYIDPVWYAKNQAERPARLAREAKEAEERRAREEATAAERRAKEALKPPISRPGDRIVLTSFSTSGQIVVWRSFQAQEEGSALARAGAAHVLILPYIACVVPAGTYAFVRETSFFRNGAPSITVLDGPSIGCKGIIHAENVGNISSRPG
jgi:hypothetical protein